MSPGGPLRVAVDATAWANPRGEGRYLRGLLPALAALDSGLALTAIAERPCRREVAQRIGAQGARGAEKTRGAGAAVVALAAGAEPGRRLARGGSRRPRELVMLQRALRRLRPALLLQPSAVGWFPMPGVPQLLGVHDIKPPGRLARQLHPRRGARTIAAAKQRLALARAEATFTVSATTAAALARAGHPAAPVATPPPDAAFRPRSAAEVERARRMVGLGPAQPFLLFSAGLNRHKDPGLAIAAVARLDSVPPPALVLVGDPRGAYGGIGDELRRAALAAGVSDRVLMPGHVEDGALAALYSGCEALISPSRFEGLGLPALEAAACGCRLVLSDIPAHRETSEGHAEWFPCGDVAALTAAIERALSAPAPAPRRQGSWHECAEVVAGALHRLAASAGAR